MLVVRSYTVLHLLMVEVTCWHGSEPAESHLLYREGVEVDQDAVSHLAAVSDVLERCYRHAFQGDLEVTDDCSV